MKPNKLALRAAFVVVVAALLFEGTVRFLLFADVANDWSIAKGLREPWRFAGTQEQHYWYLQDRGVPDERRDEAPNHDPVIGWVGTNVTSEHGHVDEAKTAERQLVLLYGDSYAQCTTSPGDCFEGLLNDSPLGRTTAMLNFGVGGFGLDQIVLLAEASLPRYLDRDPIVVVGILLDDDLDRCLLDFRCWPKPRYELVDGALVSSGEVAPTIAEHWRRRPPAPISWAWRLCARAWASGAAEAGAAAERRAEVEALATAWLERLESRLAAAKVRRFYLLFEYLDGLQTPDALQWRKDCVVRTLERLGAPWIATKPFLVEAAARDGRELAEYFGRVGRNVGHFNARGNQVAFRALLDGLERVGGLGSNSENEAWLAEIAGVVHPHASRGATPRGKSRFEFAGRELHEDRLTIECDAEGGARLTWKLLGRSSELRGSAALASTAGSAQLRWLADGAELALESLGDERRTAAFALPLAGRRELALEVTGTPNAVVFLNSPAFD
ncbi:MAG: hypothetical protein L6Q99_02805 [Planctomycetes bacterium]|nr:hypothetical protein [Planctomycetota bacterium]